MQEYDDLKLGEQVCFPLYVISKEIIGMYRPLLEKLDITYSQYLVLMVLWERDALTVNQIGEKLFLDSGTLTPLLKRLEAKNYIIRKRKACDERSVEVSLTESGQNLKVDACEIPAKMKAKLNISTAQFEELKRTVNNLFTIISTHK